MRAAPEPVVLLSVFATFRVGGPQVRFASLANHLGRRFRHVIVAMDNQFDCKDRLDPGLDVSLHPLSYDKGSMFKNLRLFRSLLRQIKPDTLVTHNWGSIEWAMANWPGLVRHVHIEDGFGPQGPLAFLVRRSIRDDGAGEIRLKARLWLSMTPTNFSFRWTRIRGSFFA